MKNDRYQHYLNVFVKEAIQNTDGSNRQIYEYLASKEIKGFFVQYKVEKKRALDDLKKAFDEHKHWPREIVLSHLGVELEK